MTETAQPADATLAAAEVHTFLIADVRGYTRFTTEHGDEAAARLAATFALVAREVVSARGGEVIELRGDEALAVFTSARQALRAATELQERFIQVSEADPSLPLQVGIGLDAGEAIPLEGGYRGAALNLAARLCSLAGPGEVLASDAVAHLARKIDGLEYAERGTVQLKGFSDPVNVVQVLPAIGYLSSPETGLQGEESGVRSPERLPIGGFLGSLPSTILVARDPEMNRILAAVDAVEGGEGRLLLLAGEPGAGKTRLAQEATLHARNRGFLLAPGTCYEPREAVPYYPFLDALAALYGAAPSAIRASVPQRWPYLGQVLPEAGIPVQGLGAEGREEQERLFRTITAFIQAIAETAPVALLLDDLQWADGSSLDLLQHLARHTRGHRVLLLGAYRDVEVGRQHPLERTLLDLNRQHLVERLPVRRLTQEGTAALIATTMGQAQVSDEFTELMQQRTEGNAFFVQEVLRALVERGDVYRENGHWERRELEEIEVPESVRAVIGQRLSRLSDQAQDLLREMSVLGQTFVFDDLTAMSGRAEDAVEVALEEAITAGLIREAGRNGYSFNHALTQQALYEEISGRRKRRLHLAVGEALERLPERVRENRMAELAWHFLEGDDPERALRYALLAGNQAEEMFARSEAEKHYRTALELAREIGDQKQLAEALYKLGRILWIKGLPDEALLLGQEAAQLYRQLGDSVMEGRVLLGISHLYVSQGNVEEAAEIIRRVERLLDSIESSTPSPDLARFYTDMGHYFFATGQYSNQLAVVERAASIAQTLGDDRLLRKAEAWPLLPLLMLGRMQEGLRIAESVIPRAEAVGDLEMLEDALSHAAETTTLSGEFDRSRVYRERQLAAQERMGDTFGMAVTIVNLSWLERCRGNWQTARAHADRALDMLRSTGTVNGVVFALHELGELALWEGEWEEASRQLEECVALAEPQGDLQFLRQAHRPLAELDLLQGRPEAALARLEPILDRPGLQEHDVTSLLPVLAWACLALGDVARATRVLTEAIDRVTTQQNRLALIDALRIKGMLLSHQQQWDKAAATFEEAVSLARSMPYPYAEARALEAHGMMATRKVTQRVPVELEQGRQQLEEALAIYQRLGAKKDVERTEQALALVDRA